MLLSKVKTGVEFETYIKDILVHSGMRVDETKKSHDFGADLLFRYLGRKYAVQCKWSKNPVGVKAVQEVVSSLVYYNAQRGVVVTNSIFTASAKRLAILNDVVLFDGPGYQPYVSDDSEMGLDSEILGRLS